MRSYLSRRLIECFFLVLATIANAQGIDSTWRLHVEDLNHHVKAEATIRLTNDIATESCIGGEWKRVIVEAIAGDEKFFPISEPLAYQLEKGFLTLGRVKVCDGYLFLDGKFTDEKISGGFNAVSIGYKKALGHFSMDRIRK